MRHAIPIVLVVILGSAAFAQSPAFEVASVKRSPPWKPGVFFGPARGGPGTPDLGQITWTYTTLKAMLMTAYDVENYQITGPEWIESERYDVVAKLGAGATKAQVRAMWQGLLNERFRIAMHRESKEFQVEDLVIGKGGSKLKEAHIDPDAPPPDGPPNMKNGQLMGPGFVTTIFPDGPRARTMAKEQPLSKLTTMLGSQLHRPVLDKTGLTGKYDFTLEFVPSLNVPLSPGGDAAEPAPDLMTAVQQQLGLRLVAAKATLELMVIDRAEKIPTEN
jgi:uncharacterized protein (TIGR03435 family)